MIRLFFVLTTTLYQVVSCIWEDRRSPPGKRVTVAGCSLHYCYVGNSNGPTIVLDHSLGGIEGYVLLEQLQPFGNVFIYDRAGYGWSSHSPHPRTSDQIVKELHGLLRATNIQPPYLLVGDSFGSYNMRLYASRFPEEVLGVVLTDGLHETGMLRMPLSLKALKLFFLSGFGMSVLGSAFGFIRILKRLGAFGLLKPELRRLPKSAIAPITRSFCRPKHWVTMMRELWNLDQSGRQLQAAASLGDLPVVNIKAQSFFKPSLWTQFLPLGQANQLRDQMQAALMQLSSQTVQLHAPDSGHFVWIDQPEVMIQAVQQVLAMTDRPRDQP